MSPTNFFEVGEQPEPWTLAQIYADLCSRKDIPRMLNVNPHRVTNWIVHRERYKAPRPLTRVGHVDIYSRQEWRAWYARWLETHQDDPRVTGTLVHGSGEEFWSYYEHD